MKQNNCLLDKAEFDLSSPDNCKVDGHRTLMKIVCNGSWLIAIKMNRPEKSMAGYFPARTSELSPILNKGDY